MVRHKLKLVLGLAIVLLSITLSAAPKTFAQKETVQQSMIVVGDSADSVQAATRAVGATITHELDVINAVAAQLTEGQAIALAADPRVQALHTNETAYTNLAIHTQRDNFSTVAYNNNDGTDDFHSDWIEGKDDNSPSSGNVVIWWGAAFLKGENVRLRRHANLENAIDVTLSFDYDRYSFDDDDDYVVIEVKYDGDWIELDRFANRDEGWGEDHASYDISQYVSNSTRIRFRTSKQLGENDTFKVDNFQIRYRIDDGSSTETVVLADLFDKQTFNGNNGTGAWSSEWIEENDFGSAYFGDVVVWDGKLWISGSDNRARRMADLSDASAATLTLSYQKLTVQYPSYIDGSDTSDSDPSEVYVTLDVSTDYGATWVELDRFVDDTADFTTSSYDLAAFVGNEVMLRFATSQQTVHANKLSIDFVEIEYVTDQQTVDDSDPFETPVSTVVEANMLHEAGITGEGVTVAIIDTGFLATSALNMGGNGLLRVLAQYDAVADAGALVNDEASVISDDDSGHGAHITSIIANSAQNATGEFLGIAPDVNLMLVKAFSADGAASYADVIRAIDKVIEYKDSLNIRVLNLSFYSTPQSHYWEDPVAQAVMRAWDAGIVVVTGAGNTGPNPLSIGVPGNVPYVITVGAITDNYTPFDTSDDYIPPFSSAGPTYDGFVKPEIVAPGAHVLGLVGPSSTLAQAYPQFALANNFFSLSGTSMATAVTSGIVALMLEADPTLSPDDVKCRLIDTARTALDDQGNLAFSIFQQGAGVVNAYDAVNSTASGCANGGLDIAADLNDTAHFIGPVQVNAQGDFIILDENNNENLAWDGLYAETNGSYLWSGGSYLWSGGSYLWSGGSYLWSGGSYLWSGGSYLWSGGSYLWSGGSYLWSGTALDPALGTASTSLILE